MARHQRRVLTEQQIRNGMQAISDSEVLFPSDLNIMLYRSRSATVDTDAVADEWVRKVGMGRSRESRAIQSDSCATLLATLTHATRGRSIMGTTRWWRASDALA